jgi:hypothetical protein
MKLKNKEQTKSCKQTKIQRERDRVTTSEIEALVPGRIYRVQIRHSSTDARGRVTHTHSRRIRRRFFGTYLNQLSIPCAVFSSALTRRRKILAEVSIPHYDLIQAEAN